MQTQNLLTHTESRAREIVAKPYARRLVPDEAGGFVASVLEFPGCFAEGDTADEALANLEKAAVAWVSVALENGREIREPISMYGHSGRVALRMPRALHQQSLEMAELDQVSLNQFLVAAIASHVAGAGATNELRPTIEAATRALVGITELIQQVARRTFQAGSTAQFFQSDFELSPSFQYEMMVPLSSHHAFSPALASTHGNSLPQHLHSIPAAPTVIRSQF